MAEMAHNRSRSARAAGALLFLAGAAVLMGIITAEALYPAGYTTGGSMISDLGGTEPPDSVVVQPSASVFDGTMIAAGLLIVAGAGCAYAATGRPSLAIPLGLVGLGALGVGVFPGGTGWPHQLFAELTFISGGVGAILSFRTLRGPLRYVTVLLGATTLVNLIAYLVLQERWIVAGLGVGGLERWIAYPVVLWLLGPGGYLMAAQERRAGTTT
jgi:hypothetical membrane protein